MSKNLLTELRSFAETTSVRGIPRVMKAKTKVTFFVWTLGVMTCAALLVWQLSVVLTRYFQYPVSTLTVQAPAWQRPSFPDITFCNLNPLVHHADFVCPTFPVLLDVTRCPQYIVAESVRCMNYFPVIGNIEKELLETDYNLVVDDSSIIALSYFDWFGNRHIISVNVKIPERVTLIQSLNPTYYKCSTLKLKDSERELIKSVSVILYIGNYSKSSQADIDPNPMVSHATGLRVAMHAPGTAPDMTLGMSIGPGTETSVLLTQGVRTRLGKPYSNCTDQLRMTGDNTSDVYTQRYCVNVCIQQKIIDKCGCVSSSVPQYSAAQLRQINYTVCDNASTGFAFFQKIICANTVRSNLSVTTTCNDECFLPCREIRYDATTSLAPWPEAHAIPQYVSTYVKSPFASFGRGIGVLGGMGFGAGFVDPGEVIVPPMSKNATYNEYRTAYLDALGVFFASNFMQLNVQFSDPTFSELVDVAAFSVDAMGAQIGGVLSLWLGVTVMLAFESFEFIFNYLTNCRKEEQTQVHPTPGSASAELDYPASVFAPIEEEIEDHACNITAAITTISNEMSQH